MKFFFNFPKVGLWALLGLCSASFLAQAQTGPGGVGNSATNKVWLKADAGFATSASGSPITLWTDQSGNGWHARQNAVVNQPTYLPNGLNGKPVLHFDRTTATQYLELTSTGIGAVMSNSNTIFAVVKANTGASTAANNAFQAAPFKFKVAIEALSNR